MGLQTTILVKPRTRNNLRKVGYKGQTYNDIIEHLLEQSIFLKNNGNNLASRVRSKSQTVIAAVEEGASE